jgi:hypothetical protein
LIFAYPKIKQSKEKTGSRKGAKAQRREDAKVLKLSLSCHAFLASSFAPLRLCANIFLSSPCLKLPYYQNDLDIYSRRFRVYSQRQHRKRQPPTAEFFFISKSKCSPLFSLDSN